MRSGRIFASDRVKDNDLSKLKAAFVARRSSEDIGADSEIEFERIVEASGLDFTPVERIESLSENPIEIEEELEEEDELEVEEEGEYDDD
jgi:hypothetical protein